MGSILRRQCWIHLLLTWWLRLGAPLCSKQMPRKWLSCKSDLWSWMSIGGNFRNTEIRVLFHIKCAQPNGKYRGKLQFVKSQVTVYDHCSRLAPLLIWRGLGCSPTAVEGFNSFRLFFLFFLAFFLPFFFWYCIFYTCTRWMDWIMCAAKTQFVASFFRLMPENHLRRASTTEHQLIRSMSRPRLH